MRANMRVVGRMGLAALVLASIGSIGCSISRVSRRPPKRDLYVLNPGTPRNRVLAELGSPIATKDESDGKLDTLAFDPGVSGAWKFSRSLFHGAADLFTLALWELIAWPAEIAAADRRTKVDVKYDQQEKVVSANYWSR